MTTLKETRQNLRNRKVESDAKLTPEQVDALNKTRADSEAQSRRAIASEANSSSSSNADTGDTDKTVIESALRSVYRVNAESFGAESDYAVLITVQQRAKLASAIGDQNLVIVGAESVSPYRLMVKIDSTIAERVIADHNANVKKVDAGENGLIVSRLYTPDSNIWRQADRVNQIVSAITNGDNGELTINANGESVKLAMHNVDGAFFGANSSADAIRKSWFVHVKLVDGTDRVIDSRWVKGLFSAINAEKLAITGDAMRTDLTSYDQRVASTEQQ